MTQPPSEPPPPNGPRETPPLPPPGFDPPPPRPPSQIPPPGFTPPPPSLPMQHPPGVGAPPPGPSAPPGFASHQSPFPQPSPPPPKKRSGCLIALAVIGVIAILVVIAAVALVVVARDSVNDAFDEASVQSSSEESDAEIGGAGDEIDDVAPCVFVDAETITLDVTNNSSKQSTYIIDVNFRNADGERLADEPFFINNLRPGERSVEDAFVFDGEGAVSCEIAEVERFASESPDDVDEVTCEVTGLDFADDIAASLVATNGSSGLSDYAVDFSIVRDGVRVGTGFAFIENVKAGESAPGDGFTTVAGPAEGATCEVVNVQRTES